MWFKKNDKNKVTESVNEVNEPAKQEATKTKLIEPVEEWIWVTGYKATEKT